MSVSKRHLADPALCDAIVEDYRTSLITVTALAAKFSVTIATVLAILKRDIPEEKRRRLKTLKYSHSKLGNKNPAKGKRPPNYRGECSDGYGYLTILVNGQRQFVHRVVMSEMLGIPVSALPSHLHIHHIDEDKTNNSPDNLALVTGAGHREIHERYLKSAEELELRGLTLAQAINYMTSKLP
jgi:hypothetical protein